MKPVPADTGIGSTALLVGGICFALGYVGPLVLSDGNLGPLLGIFVTGPAGAVAGILIGVVRSARRNPQRPLRAELSWLALAWGSGLMLLFAHSLFGLAWVALLLLAAVVGAGGYLLAAHAPQLPAWARNIGHLILAAGAFIIAASVFPPVSRPNAGDVRFAFFLDPRFDASTHVPMLSVDASMLLQEWLAIAAMTAAVAVWVNWRSSRG